MPESYVSDEKSLRIQSETPLFAYHGGKDALIPIENAKYTYEYLKNTVYHRNNQNFEFHSETELTHNFSLKEYYLLKNWINEHLK